ncbi:DUF4258 domain-containing protein [Bacillus sp. FJAT-29937]|uniref:DUF4258 domain-containing protein n=1 Tax=Bacillus sp. FJAT-29937 TaxID=1720553 RepID=UPI0008304B23|nr:DUF4258 domain-containing protein [Bacillus sp. FJAT-29937]
MRKQKKKALFNNHMQSDWDKEMQAIRHAVLSGENILTTHILEQMEIRKISVQEVAAALLNGKVVEGYDIGNYPGYRNPDLKRTVAFENSNGILVVGVNLYYNGSTPMIRSLATVFREDKMKNRFLA